MLHKEILNNLFIKPAYAPKKNSDRNFRMTEYFCESVFDKCLAVMY